MNKQFWVLPWRQFIWSLGLACIIKVTATIYSSSWRLNWLGLWTCAKGGMLWPLPHWGKLLWTPDFPLGLRWTFRLLIVVPIWEVGLQPSEWPSKLCWKNTLWTSNYQGMGTSEILVCENEPQKVLLRTFWVHTRPQLGASCTESALDLEWSIGTFCGRSGSLYGINVLVEGRELIPLVQWWNYCCKSYNFEPLNLYKSVE